MMMCKSLGIIVEDWSNVCSNWKCINRGGDSTQSKNITRLLITNISIYLTKHFLLTDGGKNI